MDKRSMNRLIKRYGAGDRDPELVRQLDEAAWDDFHDPWEVPKPVRTPLEAPVGDPDLPSTDVDPQAVLPFTFDTIKRFLADRGYNYWEAHWKAVQVFFRYSAESDRVLRLVLAVEGKRETVLAMRWTGDRRVDAERFPEALRLCNAWNQDCRWPRAFLEIPRTEPREGEEGREAASALLVLDLQLFLEQGIHQELFNSLVRDAIATGWEFWERAAKAGL